VKYSDVFKLITILLTLDLFIIRKNKKEYIITNRHDNCFLIERKSFGDFLDHTGLIRDLAFASCKHETKISFKFLVGYSK